VLSLTEAIGVVIFCVTLLKQGSEMFYFLLRMDNNGRELYLCGRIGWLF